MYCDLCDKCFKTMNGYNMHIEHSAYHQPLNYECFACDRWFATEQARHQHYAVASGHPYCVDCRRTFSSENALMQHMHSRTHVGSKMECPFCKRSFATASGVTIHLESGTCSSGLDRQKINDIVRRLDRNNVITKPLLVMPGYESIGNVRATYHAWNGRAFECYICPREFNALDSLNKHLRSPAHEQNYYHCPGRACNREYKLLSGLIQHVESESCGLMRFSQVQANAKNGVGNFVGRMIGN